jgi:hypothetical protein
LVIKGPPQTVFFSNKAVEIDGPLNNFFLGIWWLKDLPKQLSQ